ncbi:formylglycine-generating enzyme family protein [bacterium]|nr:formylglycine-generating enzyme family protein [bacterium]
MRNNLRSLILIFLFFYLLQPVSFADITVEMILNDGGFVSFDHFKAEIYLNNNDEPVRDVLIFGILEVYEEFYYWPDFNQEIDFQSMYLGKGEAWLTFLEFDFPDIDDVIPFGPMNFWGAWYIDGNNYGYDVKEFWLDTEHKWTPVPTFTSTPTATSTEIPSNTPTFTATFTPELTKTPTFAPTGTPTGTPTPTATQTPEEYGPGDLVSNDNIVGNVRYVPATGSEGFSQGSPGNEPCNQSDEDQFIHVLTRNLAVMETEVTRQMWWDLQSLQPDLPDDPTNESFGAGADNPVQRNTWNESLLFANLLSLENSYIRCYYADSGFTISLDVTNYESGQIYCNFYVNGYRLATEGEWEYFARAGTVGVFSFEESDYTSDTCSSCTSGTHQVMEQYVVYCANDSGESNIAGSKLNNPWNLEDIHGNVWEWCWDWYDSSYPERTQTDYAGSESGSYRVLRGGSWYSDASCCRSAIRNSYAPVNRSNALGFRLVRLGP